ncbi:MAG TPA: hypothetical protein VKU19_11610 [Bryobacteraceae bacterium]|nr:hypothetical protein [Bryobacteraceae bacterium]
MADIVSDLVPVVETVVDELFRPIGELRAEHEFQTAFETKSREFEPYRLYINLMLLRTIDPSNFLGVYSDAILCLTMNLSRSADEKDLPAKRIQSSIGAAPLFPRVRFAFGEGISSGYFHPEPWVVVRYGLHQSRHWRLHGPSAA